MITKNCFTSTSKKISALFILVASVSALSAQTIAWDNVNRLNSTNGTTWTPDSSNSGSHALLVGDSSNNSTMFETGVTFDISSFTTEIAGASSITLELDYDSLLGSPFPVEAYGFGASSGAIGSSFHNAGMAGSSAGTVSSFPAAPNTISYDVTTIVQSISGSQDFANFLLSANLTSNAGGGVADAIQFYRDTTLAATGARLVIVPEPGTFAFLAGLTGLGCVALRRRR